MSFKILIIEDELALQQTLKLNLELEGFLFDYLRSQDGLFHQVMTIY